MSVDNSKNVWGLVISAVVAVVVVCGAVGGMALMPLSIKADSNQKAIESLRSDMEAHKLLPSHPVMLARHEGDVHRLDERINGLAGGLSEDIKDTANLGASFQAEKSRTDSKFIEVETQMDSMAQSLNIQFANNQRTMADFQNAFHELGVKMSIAPIGPFYFPNISNRGNR